MKITIGVNGACGRMGQRIIQLAHEDKDLVLAAALEAPNYLEQGRISARSPALGNWVFP